MTSNRSRVTLLVAAGAAVASMLAGCGSDDDVATDTPTNVATDATSTSDEPTEPGTTGTPSVPTTPTTPTTPTAPTVPDAPLCADVWVAGARIPRGYRGCLEDDALVKPDRLGCSSGQSLIRYDDEFYGVAGGTINQGTSPLLDDADYTAEVERCRA